jgi:hypothetical protein
MREALPASSFAPIDTTILLSECGCLNALQASFSFYQGGEIMRKCIQMLGLLSVLAFGAVAQAADCCKDGATCCKPDVPCCKK